MYGKTVQVKSPELSTTRNIIEKVYTERGGPGRIQREGETSLSRGKYNQGL